MAGGVIAEHIALLRSKRVTYEKHQFGIEYDLSSNTITLTLPFKPKPAEMGFVNALRRALKRQMWSLKISIIKAEIRK